MTIPSLVDGQLPMGRWVCTPDEVETTFVAPDTVVRAAIWEDWLKLRDALRAAVGELPACGFSGSFFTNKKVPGDIDCLWVVDAVRWVSAFNAGDRALQTFLLAAASSSGFSMKTAYGLKVDSYVLEWVPSAGTGRDVSVEPYFGNRGYWDNLWVRVKDSDARLSSIPRRGYLEVILDGYR